VRAEPIAALYEQGRVAQAGAADRVDAMVWALSDLFPRMVKPQEKTDWSSERGSCKASWLAG
jgi:phage terminase large subunit-like protein